ncbi:FtsX-like permease family protein [Kordia zhangzhouensis]|uniref:FtsX-like permease family protein n=1 Tax=Kordia zhangzhouensis TaxID=1620405 RepID=UPI0012FB2521|nr:FtsX-like permease family protein [Kordia zhangzhouensis]
MIRSLLHKQLRISQLLFFALTSSIGLGILLVVFQLFIDTRPLFDTSNDLLGKQNLIIYKNVGKNNVFTRGEIQEIAQQNFTKKVGGFTHGTYRVAASVTLPNYASISTEMFLEAIPDDFIDIKSDEWNWKPGDREVPIIIPKNYINLYNFGYAASTGMPQINETIIREIPIDLSLVGTTQQKNYRAYVLAASEKLNSILVPASFLKHTNQLLSPNKTPKISRLIIEVTNPSDPSILDFLEKKKFKYLKNDVQTSRISYFLQLILWIVLSIGFLITALSILLVITNINLLILKNKQTICQLYFLGYSRKNIAKVYLNIALKILAFSIVIALVIAIICKCALSSYLEILQSNTTIFSIGYLVIFAAILFIVFASYYRRHIYQKITQLTKVNTSLLTTEI